MDNKTYDSDQDEKGILTDESVRDEEDEETDTEDVTDEGSKSLSQTEPGSFHVDQKHTFGKKKTRDIAVENMRIAERLAKVKHQLKPKQTFPRTVLASSAINRKKMQWEIERKNAILAKRIADAKSCLTYKPRVFN